MPVSSDAEPVRPDPARSLASGRRAGRRPRRVRNAVRIDPRLVETFRPEAPALIETILAEIQRVVSAYGPDAGMLYLANTRLTIERAVAYFLDWLVDPATPRAELDDTVRHGGRGEAYEGRGLESFLTALRIGASIAAAQVRAVLEAAGMTARDRARVEQTISEFVDSLGDLAALGYREAQEQLSDAAHMWQRRVLDLVLAGDHAAPGDLAAAAALGSWRLPESVVAVAVRVDPDVALPRARMVRPPALTNLNPDRPVVLLPAPVSPHARTEITTLFTGHRLAFGAPVPLREAAASLRWARRALELSAVGILPDVAVLDCAEHIGTLWIHSEPLLAEMIDNSLLAPLYAESPNSRRILGETLLAWIETRGASAPMLAALLDKHPQTVRYRLKRLRTMFGAALDDPQRVTEMHYALRAGVSRWHGGALPAALAGSGVGPEADD